MGEGAPWLQSVLISIHTYGTHFNTHTHTFRARLFCRPRWVVIVATYRLWHFTQLYNRGVALNSSWHGYKTHLQRRL